MLFSIVVSIYPAFKKLAFVDSNSLFVFASTGVRLVGKGNIFIYFITQFVELTISESKKSFFHSPALKV